MKINENLQHKICLFLFLCIVVFLPCLILTISEFQINTSYSAVADTNSFYYISNKVNVTQQIDTNAKIEKLSIKVLDLNLNSNDIIKIEIRQNEKILSQTVDNNVVNEKKAIDLDMSMVERGSFSFELLLESGNQDSFIKILTANNIILGSIIDKGKEQNLTLVFDVECSYIPRYSYIRIIFIFAIFILCIVSWYSLINNVGENNSKKLYILSIFIILFTLCVKYPMMSILPEAYNEVGSIFFHQTIENGAIKSLFIGDFGYWPFFQHLVANIVVLVLHQTKNAILFMQLFSIIIVSIICSKLCRSKYETFFPTEIRFCIAIILGSSQILINEQMLAFINFVYFALLLVIFNFMLDLNDLKKWEYIFIILSSIMVLSKATFVVLIPIFLLIMFISFMLKQRRYFIYSVALNICVIAQIIYVMSRSDTAHFPQIPNIKMILDSIYYFIQIVINLIFPVVNQIFNGLLINSILFCIILSSIILCLFKIREKKHVKTYFMILCSYLIGIGSVLFDTITVGYIKLEGDVSWKNCLHINRGRITIFATISIIIIAILFLSLIRIKKIYIITLLTVIGIRFNINPIDASDISYQRGNWKNYYSLFKNDSYAIPLLDRRFVKKNAEVLFVGKENCIDTREWNYSYGSKPILTFDSEIEYLNQIDFSNIDNFESKSIITLYANKAYIAQDDNISAIFYDVNDKQIAKINALPVIDRISLGFVLDKPIQDVFKIRFVNSQNIGVSMQNEVYIVVKN